MAPGKRRSPVRRPLQRLQGRFTVNVELSDTDVEVVTRRVVLAKRPDRTNAVKSTLDDNTGEINRHLVSTRISPRSEDEAVLVEDYPLLPVRRRFWEHTLRAVDRAGTAGQLRTQLRIVYDAIRYTADDPVGTVVPADFLFEEISPNLLRSGVLLREVNETIFKQDDGTPDGRLKLRLCALVFLIRKLPREAGIDIGVRATEETLADLLVKDLAQDGATLRGRLPALLDELTSDSTLMKLEDEYSLQTRESSEWENEFRNRQTRLVNDLTQMSSKRAQLLGAAVQEAIGSVRLLHGTCKEPRKIALHLGAEPPLGATHEIPVWIRDGWGADEGSVVADARADGSDSPVIHVFLPKSRADDLARVVAAQAAANETLEYKGVPSTAEGIEARQGMETRRTEAANNQRSLVAAIVGDAKVYQGGGSEWLGATLQDKIKEVANASLDRLFHDFRDADDGRWSRVIERARRGAEHPLEVLDYDGKTEELPGLLRGSVFRGFRKEGQRGTRPFFGSALRLAPRCDWTRPSSACLEPVICGRPPTARRSSLGSSIRRKCRSPIFGSRAPPSTPASASKYANCSRSLGSPASPTKKTTAAAEFLAELDKLAQGAGGDAPLPERPDTSHLRNLQSLAGNEQLVGILNRYDELQKNIEDWDQGSRSGREAIPRVRTLTVLNQPCKRDGCGVGDAAADRSYRGQPQFARRFGPRT